jgi:hypothetical protein
VQLARPIPNNEVYVVDKIYIFLKRFKSFQKYFQTFPKPNSYVAMPATQLSLRLFPETLTSAKVFRSRARRN